MGEFVRRAAFATLAGLAVHDKAAEDRLFLDALPLIEKYAFDDRNFVRKSVNWALRNIGKRNATLRPPAIACAQRIRAQGTRAARWIAADALRELVKVDWQAGFVTKHGAGGGTNGAVERLVLLCASV